MKFRISRLAQNDLEEIWLFTEKNGSVFQADRYLNLLFEEIDFIVRNPASGSDFSHVRDGYFRTKVKSHFNPENALENLFRAYPPRRTNQRLRRLFFCIRSAATNFE